MPDPSAPLRAAARLLALLALAVAALVVRAAVARPPLLIIGHACDHAVRVDGLLRCGDAAPVSLADLCPGQPGALPLRSGDAVRRLLLCTRPDPERGAIGWRRMDPEDLAALSLPVQINEADAAELASLPGVGPVLAGRILAARPFARVDELDRVKGIGPRKLAALRPRARVTWAQAP